MNWQKTEHEVRESPTNAVTRKRYEVTCWESVVE